MTSSFIPRAFPPPSLAGVPIEYIIDQLHRLAPHYWTKPETADCTIIIPHDPTKPPHHSTPSPLSPSTTTNTQSHSRAGRRATVPAYPSSSRTAMKLHVDYLSAHSSLLRGLFSGSSAIDLLNISVGTSSSAQRWITSPNRIPHSLPSSPTHPIIFLPLPDPSSFHLLVQWMYFGTTKDIEQALNAGTVTWEGITRNVEYLDIRQGIRTFLGRWYGKWRMTSRQDIDSMLDDDSDDSEDEDDGFACVTSVVDTDASADAEDEDESDEEPETRAGRRTSHLPSRTQKCHTSSDPAMSCITTTQPVRSISR